MFLQVFVNFFFFYLSQSNIRVNLYYATRKIKSFQLKWRYINKSNSSSHFIFRLCKITSPFEQERDRKREFTKRIKANTK